MFLRKKTNKSGSVSIQVIQKVGRTNKVVKTIGCSKDTFEIDRLWKEGQKYLEQLLGQTSLPLYKSESDEWFAQIMTSIEKIELVGPRVVLGKIYDDIGFSNIGDDLLKQLVISRIITPSSKLRTVRDLEQYYGIQYSVDKIYRFMDKIACSLKGKIQRISYEHTLKILGGVVSMVFYDVTTIYFEVEKEDDLRKAGFSKDGKHQHPQIVLGLLVGIDGYPMAYDIFPGNTYEGHTLLPVLDKFKQQYQISQLIIVADAGLINKKNIKELQKKNYDFIIGARIKTEAQTIKDKILNLELKDAMHAVIEKPDKTRLIVHYSDRRARKDHFNRKRGLNRLEKALKTGKLGKAHINNKGYNKYLALEGDIKVKINYEKYEQDSKWDGLKGYLTNTNVDPNILLKNYSELWKIEKAFKISKTDLRVRPIYHRLSDRIEAHICISFTAYKVYKELERLLKTKKASFSVTRAIELIKSIQEITITHRKSGVSKRALLKPTEEQLELINLIK